MTSQAQHTPGPERERVAKELYAAEVARLREPAEACEWEDLPLDSEDDACQSDWLALADDAIRIVEKKGALVMEIGEFHWRDGWYFKRLDTGRVRIIKRAGDDEVIRVEVPAPEWASIIAHVSARGETTASYQEALRFHDER